MYQLDVLVSAIEVIMLSLPLFSSKNCHGNFLLSLTHGNVLVELTYSKYRTSEPNPVDVSPRTEIIAVFTARRNYASVASVLVIVTLSICLTRALCVMKEHTADILIPHEKAIIPVF